MDVGKDYSRFVCIVAGDNPDELMEQYSEGDGHVTYIAYKFEEAGKIHQNFIKTYSLLCARETEDWKREMYEEELESIKEDTDAEFFARITEQYHHDKDGNAVTNKNPNAKFQTYQVGKAFSVPFKTYDGEELYSAIKEDIDWDKIHISSIESMPYKVAWETVIEKRPPETDFEKQVYANMSGLTEYLKKFKTKENYIACSCSFWGYAFLSEESGWKELEPNMDQFEWVSSFFEKFIVPLPETTRLTIYECRRY